MKPFEVLYEDGHFAVVVKPAGIPTHHQKGHRDAPTPAPDSAHPLRGWHAERLLQYFLQVRFRRCRFFPTGDLQGDSGARRVRIQVRCTTTYPCCCTGVILLLRFAV